MELSIPAVVVDLQGLMGLRTAHRADRMIRHLKQITRQQ